MKTLGNGFSNSSTPLEKQDIDKTECWVQTFQCSIQKEKFVNEKQIR